MQHISELNTTLLEAYLDWGRITRAVAFLIGDREALPVHITPKGRQAVSRQLLIVTGECSQLQSLSSKACPVCIATASACITMCIKAFERGEPLPAATAFCQNHHWILAASIVLQKSLTTTHTLQRYRTWLKQQLEHQVQALLPCQEYTFSEREQNCIACVYAAEAITPAVTSVKRSLRQASNDANSATTEGGLLCLFHWKHVHEACTHEPDAIALQRRLLSRQQQHLAQLDRTVEAYLARFNAAKRERGEVPDIPGAAEAWERLLAFFAGEPTLEYTINI